MPWSLEHINWLSVTNTVHTVDGKDIPILEFNPQLTETSMMSDWAKHFRNHYCFDDEIDRLREGTGLSRTEFLKQLKLPTDARGFGPAIRSGDFAEILVSDYLEYCLDFVVPRTRYGNKTIRDESTKGSDIIGFKLFDGNKTPRDILATLEVKAQFSGNNCDPRLQDAIDDSLKDEIRKAESLSAMKQRLLDKGKMATAQLVQRFQNPTDLPYTQKYGAAALFCSTVFDEATIQDTDASGHPFKENLFLVTIKADDFMNLVHQLYNLAADEA